MTEKSGYTGGPPPHHLGVDIGPETRVKGGPTHTDDTCRGVLERTCVKTNGQLLVCDLQGVNKHDGGFQLTDPAINSVTQEYGNTDLGKLGIYLFFALHECTGVCKRLKLTERVPEVIPPEITRLVREYAKAPTTYAELLSSITQINQNLPTPVLKAPPPPPPSRTRSLRPSTRKRTRKCLIQ